MARGYENPQQALRPDHQEARLDERAMRQVMREVLPYGRALDRDELRRMIQETSQDNKATMLRRRLLDSAAGERAGALLLDAAELERVRDYINGKIPGDDGKRYSGQAGATAPIRSWP